MNSNIKDCVPTMACRESTTVEILRQRASELHKRATQISDVADKLEHNELADDRTLRDLIIGGIR